MKGITMNKARNKFLDDLANNSPNADMFDKTTLKDIKKQLNEEYPKLMKAINSKTLTQQQKRSKAEEFTRLLEELADHYMDS